jgi:ubiquinone/menaquinone biosynthesis C-methylase UbiE
MLYKSIVEQNRKAYNVLAESYTKEWAENLDLPLADSFLKMLKKDSKILDVGCGPGHYSSYFIDKGHSVDSIDISSEMLRLARQRDNRLQVRTCDMLNLDYQENEFDGLWVCASLPHIPKGFVDQVLRGFHRILKYEGCMLVNAIIGNLEHRIETSEEMGEGYNEPGRFFQWYSSSDAFKKIIESCDFEVQSEQHRIVTSRVLKKTTLRRNSWYSCFCNPV